MLQSDFDILDCLIKNLDTLGNVQKNTKISTTKDFISINDVSYSSGVTRWLAGESRDRAIRRIYRDVQCIIAISSAMLDSKYLVYGSESKAQREDLLRKIYKIRCALINADRGIGCLCQTYTDDANATIPLKQISSTILAHTAQLAEVLTSFDVGIFNM